MHNGIIDLQSRWIFVDGDATGQLNAKRIREFRLQTRGWSDVLIQGGAEVSGKLITQVQEFDTDICKFAFQSLILHSVLVPRRLDTRRIQSLDG